MKNKQLEADYYPKTMKKEQKIKHQRKSHPENKEKEDG